MVKKQHNKEHRKEHKESKMSKMSEKGAKGKPQNERNEPNPSLRKGTNTMNMAKAMLKGPQKKMKSDKYVD